MERLLAYAGCMRRHGSPSCPDPNGRGTFVLPDIDLRSSQLQCAQQTCTSAAHVSGPMRIQATNAGPSAPPGG